MDFGIARTLRERGITGPRKILLPVAAVVALAVFGIVLLKIMPKKAAILSPAWAWPCALMGQIYYYLDDLAQAEEWLKTRAELFSGNYEKAQEYYQKLGSRASKRL